MHYIRNCLGRYGPYDLSLYTREIHRLINPNLYCLFDALLCGRIIFKKLQTLISIFHKNKYFETMIMS